MNPYRIAIIGTGYVGLVVGACFAEYGRFVTCIDRDKSKIDKLKAGKPLFYEPGLDTLIERNIRYGRIAFTTDTEKAVKENDIIMLAVGTPLGENGKADLSQVWSAAEAIGQSLDHEALVVVKSTVPVGTTKKTGEIISRYTDASVKMAFNPEFLREGNAVMDFLHPNRTVVGSEEKEVGDILAELYQPFISPQSPFVCSDIVSAELIKYTANAMLATKISFINDMANLCERVGGDIEAIKRGVGLDDRIGDRFLNPGLGFGGSCFPKDLHSIVHTAGILGEQMPILRAVMEVNQRMRQVYLNKILDRFGQDLNGRCFAVWGLSFKPDTDDIREAPALTIIRELCSRGAVCQAYDPEAMENTRLELSELAEQVTYCESAYQAAANADALLVLTEWSEFRSPDWKRIRETLKTPLVFDGRNIYNIDDMIRRGFSYHSMGRPPGETV